VSACGGDLGGTWKITANCATLTKEALNPASDQHCAQTSIDAANSQRVEPVDATISFAADGTYSEAGTMHLETTFVFTPACLQIASIPEDKCVGLAGGIKQTYKDTSCAIQGHDCRCAASGDVALNQSGTYRIEGTKIYVDNGTQAGAFCVQGQTASVFVDTGMGASGTLELSR
jgi:hypothetical protein